MVAVSSAMESRIILDASGAEKLIGKPLEGSSGQGILKFTQEDWAKGPAAFKALLLEKGKEAKIEQRLTIEPSLQAPVEKGAVAGYVEFYVDGELQTKVPIRVTADNGEIGFSDIFSRVLKKLLAFA